MKLCGSCGNEPMFTGCGNSECTTWGFTHLIMHLVCVLFPHPTHMNESTRFPFCQRLPACEQHYPEEGDRLSCHHGGRLPALRASLHHLPYRFSAVHEQSRFCMVTRSAFPPTVQVCCASGSTTLFREGGIIGCGALYLR